MLFLMFNKSRKCAPKVGSVLILSKNRNSEMEKHVEIALIDEGGKFNAGL